MIQVSHGDNLDLDPPISSNAERIVKATFNFKNILDYDISLVFVSKKSLLGGLMSCCHTKFGEG